MSLSRSDVISAIGGLFGALAFMIVVTPSEALIKLGPWVYVLGATGAALVLWSAYRFGYRSGAKNLKPVVQLRAKVLSVDALIYATNQIATLVLEEGSLPAGLDTYTPRIIRDHPAWHDDRARLARDNYLKVVKKAVEARYMNSPGNMWMAGGGALDFRPDDRLQFSRAVTQKRDDLIAALRATGAAKRKPWWRR